MFKGFPINKNVDMILYNGIVPVHGHRKDSI
jgi:hypothetical protein